jgi:very-short-patch-repair endonuclease
MPDSERPSHSGIVRGLPVKRVKQERARDLRRTMTPAESRLWQELRAHRLDEMHWRRQQVIAGFIVDFYCSAARLVIEVDGPIHAAQAEFDAARDQALAAHHLRILRFTNREVTDDLDHVLMAIREAGSPRPCPSS